MTFPCPRCRSTEHVEDRNIPEICPRCRSTEHVEDRNIPEICPHSVHRCAQCDFVFISPSPECPSPKSTRAKLIRIRNLIGQAQERIRAADALADEIGFTFSGGQRHIGDFDPVCDDILDGVGVLIHQIDAADRVAAEDREVA